MSPADRRDDGAAGAILGLAVGDALGYPHEFRTVAQVRAEIGPGGLTGFVAPKDPRFTPPSSLAPSTRRARSPTTRR